ncbi:MAG: helix-turn-helix transcriptional regulator [Ignavibacteriaceae bacterium]|nr:helix-turn-helix transcriptional regulator [Ignavibacteriaceae bacterium]
MKEKLNDDLERYIAKRKRKDKIFARDFEVGYENFKIGVLLKQAREEAGISQEELANRLNTQKSAISRIENHSEDIRLSTLKEYLEAVGKKLSLRIL